VKCYGYHDAGYALFFKPDLSEVIKIAQDEIRASKVCFVTTQPCNEEGIENDNVAHCFDSHLYKHTAVTTLWCI